MMQFSYAAKIRAQKAEKEATAHARPAWMSDPSLLPKEPPLGRRRERSHVFVSLEESGSYT